MTRECGSCTECCYALGVHELDKRPMARCRHEKPGKGCAVYNTRPTSCREFSCVWLQGEFDKKDRPDRIGIVFATSHMADRQVVIAYVRKNDADLSGRGKQLIDLMGSLIPVCIYRRDGTKRIALPESMEALIPKLRAEFNAEGVVEHGADGSKTWHRLPVVQ